MLLQISRWAKWGKDLRVLVSGVVILLVGVFWSGWYLRPIFSTYHDVSKIQELAEQNHNQISTVEKRVDQHGDRIMSNQDQILSLETRQQELSRLMTGHVNDFRIFACNQVINNETFDLLNCKEIK